VHKEFPEGVWLEAIVLERITSNNAQLGNNFYKVIIIDNKFQGHTFDREESRIRKYKNANTMDTYNIDDQVTVKVLKNKHKKFICYKAKVLEKEGFKYNIEIIDKEYKSENKFKSVYPFMLKE
jgi:hypothetical protein